MSDDKPQTAENKVTKVIMVVMVFAAFASVMVCLMGGIPVAP